MAHDVMFQIPDRPVGNADIGFRMRKDGTQFGRLRVSKGAIVWLPGKQVDRFARDEGARGHFPV